MATKLRIVAPDKINPKTMETRWSDPCVRNWLCATQHWAWNGGDAIVVPTNDICICWVVIRVGKKVQVVAANSFNHACESVGLDPKKFVIVAS